MNKKQRDFYQNLISQKNKQDTVLAAVISIAILLSVLMAVSSGFGVNMLGRSLVFVAIGLLAAPVMIGFRAYGRIFHDTLFGKDAAVYAILPVSVKDNIRIRMNACGGMTVIAFTDVCYAVAMISVLSFAGNEAETRHRFFSRLGELILNIRPENPNLLHMIVLIVLLITALTATAICWEMGVFLGTVAANTFSDGKGSTVSAVFVVIIWILAFFGIEHLIWIPLRSAPEPDIITAITTLAIRTLVCSAVYFIERGITKDLLENHYMLV